jgi:hypothetical protein
MKSNSNDRSGRIARFLATVFLASAVGALSSCQKTGGAAPQSSPSKAATPTNVDYNVFVDPDGELEIDARFAPGAVHELKLEDDMGPFVSNLSVNGADTTPKWDGSSFEEARCTDGCELRYRFDLPGAAAKAESVDTALEFDGTFVTTPSTWLIRPGDGAHSGHFAMRVKTDEKRSFAWGVASHDGVFEGSLDDLDEAPYAALGSFRHASVPDAGPEFELVLVGPEPDLGDAAIVGWVHEALLNLRTFYPDYPKHHLLFIALVRRGSGIGEGTTMGNGGATIQVSFGQATAQPDIDDDWILTHEMFHVSFPGLARVHHWAEEGMATYLEPIARARRGVIPIERVWKEWYKSMSLGQPYEDDQGLDQTATWGRTYWGGALFWFLSDVRVRKETHAERGAPDIFAGIYKAGDIADRWPIRTLLETADAATGTHAVSEIYAEHSERPVRVDLDGLFKDLGVGMRGGKISFDDAAPLANVRRAIVVGPEGR